jgi:hypothetical protein
MTIKPVLVPDQDAATLRRLMDQFAEVTTGPTRQELTESRAAVAAAPGVAEGLGKDTSGTFVDRVVGEIMNYQSLNNANPKFADLSSAVKSKLKSLGEIKAKQIYQQALKQAAELSGQQGVAEGSGEFNKIKTTPYKANQMLGGKDPVAFAIEVLCPDQSVVKTIQNKIGTAYQIERDDAVEGNGIGIEIISQSFEGGRTAQAAYKQILDIIKQSGGQFNNSTEVTIARQTQGVTEARPDVMRHAGDRTIKIVKRGGKPIGEIGTDAEASPGNGQYYVKLYDGSYDAVGFDTAAEALAELKAAVRQGMSEAAAPEFKPGDRVQFTSPRGAVEDGVVVKDLYPGAVEVKFDSGETRGVYANSLKPLPAAVAESIDPVEQLRADILRFSR